MQRLPPHREAALAVVSRHSGLLSLPLYPGGGFTSFLAGKSALMSVVAGVSGPCDPGQNHKGDDRICDDEEALHAA